MSNHAELPAAPIPIAVAVVEHQGCFLVGVRPAGATLAGLAEFPGGKIEPGETPAQAAVRECLEETGLVVEVTGEYPSQVQPYEHASVALHFLACAPCAGSTPGERQPHKPFHWVSRKALKQREFPAGNRRLLEYLTR